MTARFHFRALCASLVALAAIGAPRAQPLDAVTGEALPGVRAAMAEADLAAPARLGADLELVGRLATGETRGIALVGSRLYQSNGGYLDILDVTDPAAPVLQGRFLSAQGVVQGVFVNGTTAYVPVSRGNPYRTLGSLQVVDVSDPAAPVGLGAITGRSYFDAVVSGTTLYAAGTGLRLFDVSTPAAPVAQGVVTIAGGSPLSVVVTGTTAYVASGNPGLGIIDASNPAAPTLTGALALGGFATRVAVAGTRAYVSVNGVGLVVVDVSDPAAPVELGRFADDSSQIRSVAVSGVTAYLGTDRGFVALDVSDPAAIARLGDIDFGVPGSGQSIVLDGTTAYVGNRYSGVRVLDVAAPAAITETRLIANGGFSFKVTVVGETAYVSDLIGQMRIVDLANPVAPVERGRVQGIPNANGADVSGTTAYLVNRSDPPNGGVTRIDVSNPANPTVLGFTPTALPAFGVDVSGSTVFVATGSGADGQIVSADGTGGGFTVLDSEATGNQAFGLAVSGGRAYAATFGSGLSILDATTPAALAPLSLNSIGGFSSAVEVDGTTAYLADSQIGSALALSIIDASNPAAPVLLATADGIAGGTAVDVAVGNGYAYATVDFVGLFQYDVDNPAMPTLATSVQTADRATGVDTYDDGRYVVLVDAGAGLWVFRTPPMVATEGTARTESLSAAAFPNPAAGVSRLRVSLPDAAAVTVEVFSALGRRIARLDAGALAAGAHTLDLDASVWPAGVYVVRVTAGGETTTSRLTVAR